LVLAGLLALSPLTAAAADGVRVLPLAYEPLRGTLAPPRPAALSERQQDLLREVGAARHRPAAATAAPPGRRRAGLASGRRPSPSAAAPTPVRFAGGAEIESYLRASGAPRLVRAAARPGSVRPLLQSPQPLLALTEEASDEYSARMLLRQHRGYLRLDQPDAELALVARDADALGQRHLRFVQYHRGVPVWPAQLRVHLDAGGGVRAVTGDHLPTPQHLVVQPALSADAAQERARTAVSGGGAAEFGAAELIVYAPADSAPRLAWRLDTTVSLRQRWTLVVDALDGTLLNTYSRVQEAAEAGSGTDLFGARLDLSVWNDGSRYYLTDTSKPMYDPASTPPKAVDVRGGIIVSDAANKPPNSNPQTIPPSSLVSSAAADSGWLADGVSAAVGLSRVYDYFLECHGRNSTDGQGGNILSVVRLGRNYDNAFWASDLNSMFFGDADVYAGALDVVAHELTHGVTSYTANLLYQDQPGALNEAFSDIFGEMVEAYAAGSRDGSCAKGGNDWQIGTSLRAGAFRDLKEPGRFDSGLGPYPARMSEYIRTQDDYGGVHINSSIINHGFYLLAEGIDGAIGRRDAERIFYRALTVYLTQNAQFFDARLACEQAAEDLFGADSAQLIKTRQAFDAVEIGVDGGGGGGTPVAVGGNDAMVFVFPFRGEVYLGRREFADDGAFGVDLSWYAAARSRPSVSADGRLAAYVSSNLDFCMVPTAKPYTDSCLGFAGEVHSVAMSADGNTFAFVLMDNTVDPPRPENRIVLFRVDRKEIEEYQLLAPATEGITIDSVVEANSMAFAGNGRYLVYDARNRIEQEGSQVEAWSIYALDLALQQTRVLVPPVLGLDIRNPALGLLSDDHLTFEAIDRNTGKSSIYATRFSRSVLGELQPVASATVSAETRAMPSFAGDDGAIYYSDADAAATTVGRSIYRQPLRVGEDGTLAADGSATVDLPEAEFATVYRRGKRLKLTVQRIGRGDGQVTDSSGEIHCGFTCSELYPYRTRVSLRADPAFGSSFLGWRGACRGRGECQLTMRRRKTVAAVFSPMPVLKVVKHDDGSGTVLSTPAGIDCGTGCSESEARFARSTRVRLSAQADAGSEFSGWAGACRGKSACTVHMKGNRLLFARFRRQPDGGG